MAELASNRCNIPFLAVKITSDLPGSIFLHHQICGDIPNRFGYTWPSQGLGGIGGWDNAFTKEEEI
jgi:hypothetical protein